MLGNYAPNLHLHVTDMQVLPLLLVTYRWYNNPRTKTIPTKAEPPAATPKPKKPKDVEWYYKRLQKDNAVAEKQLRLANC